MPSASRQESFQHAPPANLSLARIEMMTTHNPGTRYPHEPIVNKGELPDPFVPAGDDGRISRRNEWPACARAWRDMIIDLEYGGMPPVPESLTHETLCHNNRRTWPGKPNFIHLKTGTSSSISLPGNGEARNPKQPTTAIHMNISNRRSHGKLHACECEK